MPDIRAVARPRGALALERRASLDDGDDIALVEAMEMEILVAVIEAGADCLPIA